MEQENWELPVKRVGNCSGSKTDFLRMALTLSKPAISSKPPSTGCLPISLNTSLLDELLTNKNY